MNEEQKQARDVIETDFSRQYYSRTLNNIFNANKMYSDPAEFSSKTTAELEGTMMSFPDNDKPAIGVVPKLTIDSLTDYKIEQKAEQEYLDAEKRNSLSIYSARDVAIQAKEDDLPELAQAAADSVFLDFVNQEKQKGKISQKFERTLMVDYAKAVTMTEFSKNLISDKYTSEQKLNFLQKFYRGETGVDAIDKYSRTYERAKNIEDALTFVNKYDNYKESLKQQEERARKENFQQAYKDASMRILLGDANPFDTAYEQMKLMSQAKTIEEIQQVSEIENMISPKATSPAVIAFYEDAIANGTFNEDLVMAGISRHILVGAEAKRLIEYAKQPLNINLNTPTAKASLEGAKINFSKDQGLYSVWHDMFMSKLKGKVMTDDEIQKAAKDAYDFMRPYIQDTKTEQKITKILQARRDGISTEKLNSIANNSISKIKAKYNTDELGLNQINEIQSTLRNEMNEYIRREKTSGRKVVIVNDDDEEIDNEKLIVDTWIAMVKKQRGW